MENPLKSALLQLSETSFPISFEQPVNLRIMLHAAALQMSSSRLRKVTLLVIETQ